VSWVNTSAANLEGKVFCRFMKYIKTSINIEYTYFPSTLLAIKISLIIHDENSKEMNV
jgi:hypothetical protein